MVAVSLEVARFLSVVLSMPSKGVVCVVSTGHESEILPRGSFDARSESFLASHAGLRYGPDRIDAFHRAASFQLFV